jgi:hypothetical protein
MLLPIVGFSAAWNPSDHARAVAVDIDAARVRGGLSKGEMAFAMGLSEAALSRQLNLHEPMNVYRLADLPASFWIAFLLVRAQRYALCVIEDLRLVSLLNAIQSLADSPRKRMAKASLLERQQERVSA